MKEMLGGCCVCADENGWTGNPLVYCDGPGCEVAVHQGCYGILEVPDGEWLCAKCAAGSSNGQTYGMNVHSDENRRNGRLPTRCELCPFGYGALKRTETGGWAHVICALYIPEVRFGDVHSMDPIVLQDVPHERFEKSCYLCEEEGHYKLAGIGACMACNRPGCKRGFHVTCAQQRGLLCEEGGQGKNVKYCGYCDGHLKKAAGDPCIKIIPAVRVRPLAVVVPVHPTPPTSDPGVPPQNSTAGPSPPHPAANTATMLVDPIPRPDPHPSLAGLPANGSAEDAHHFNNFSPPLTVSSQSSVAHDATPPLGSAVKPETPTQLGPPIHHLHNFNALLSAANQASELTNHNRIGTPSNLSCLRPISPQPHTNGLVEVKLESGLPTAQTLPASGKAVSAKRTREPKVEGDKPKRPRNSHRPSNANRMKTLLDLVGPVVSETVSDFQRERVADRAAAAAAQPGPSRADPGLPLSNVTLFNGATLQAAAQPSVLIANAGGSLSCMGGPSPSRPSHQSSLPSSMEQLLERQWEQGTQFLLSQSQPFDVAQLLTCLHQLKTENVRLEEQLSGLSKRKEHLIALNARLSMPLAPLPTVSIPPLSQQHSQMMGVASGPSVLPSLPSPHHSPQVPSSSHAMPPGEDSLAQLRNMAAGGVVGAVQTPLSSLPPRPSSLARPPSQAPPTSYAPPTSSTHSFLPQHQTPPQQQQGIQQSFRPPVSLQSHSGQLGGASQGLPSSPAPSADVAASQQSGQQTISPERLMAPLLPTLHRNLLAADPLLLQQLLLTQQQRQQQNLFGHAFAQLMMNPQMQSTAGSAGPPPPVPQQQGSGATATRP